MRCAAGRVGFLGADETLYKVKGAEVVAFDPLAQQGYVVFVTFSVTTGRR
jgi:hypothetical protein